MTKKFKLFTRCDIAKTVAKRWKDTYSSWAGLDCLDYLEWMQIEVIKGEKKCTGIIFDQLIALGNDPDPDEIDKIIGNDTWTRNQCSMCHSNCDKLVGTSDPFSNNLFCQDCLIKMIVKLNEVESK